jgi:hypothetical protein
VGVCGVPARFCSAVLPAPHSTIKFGPKLPSAMLWVNGTFSDTITGVVQLRPLVSDERALTRWPGADRQATTLVDLSGATAGNRTLPCGLRVLAVDSAVPFQRVSLKTTRERPAVTRV